MELMPAILSPAVQWVGASLYALGLALALWRMPWYWLARPEVASRIAGACVGTLVLWQVRAEIPDGPTVHLLGATLLTLAFGWQVAILALAVALTVTTAVEHSGWMALGANGSVLVLAVLVSYACARASERLLPSHMFVYIFGAAFFGSAVAVVFASLGAVGWMYASAVMDGGEVLGNYLPFSLLLLFPEAFMTGGLATLAVIYRPEWLVSWDDKHYIGED